MFWNLLCNIVEKNHFNGVLDDPFNLFQQVKLFKFNSEECVNYFGHIQTWESSNYDSLIDLFRLPFPVTGIEDPSGITIYIDSKENQFGLDDDRFCISYNGNDFDLKSGILTVSTISKVFLSKRGFDMEMKLHCFGAVTDGKLKTKYSKKDEINFMYLTMPEDERGIFKEGSIYRLLNVMDLINPKNFILEESNLNIKCKKKRILREHQRPIYTILEPSKIRKIMHIKEPSHGSHRSPIPHERSGHYRVLKHPKYGKNVGKHIWIKPVWVGDSEATVGNKFYKVIL